MCMQVKDKEPLSEAEKDHRFKELVYWYMESFSSENSDHEKGWVVVLGHPRFGGAWYVGSFPEVDLLGKKQSVETCLERLNKEFSTEFEVVLKREDYNRFSARYVMLGWLHLDNDDKLDCGDQVRVKPVEGGEKNMFAAANKEWLQKLGVRMDKVDEPVDACIDAEMDKVDKPVDAGMKVVDTEEKVEVIELD